MPCYGKENDKVYDVIFPTKILYTIMFRGKVKNTM